MLFVGLRSKITLFGSAVVFIDRGNLFGPIQKLEVCQTRREFTNTIQNRSSNIGLCKDDCNPIKKFPSVYII